MGFNAIIKETRRTAGNAGRVRTRKGLSLTVLISSKSASTVSSTVISHPVCGILLLRHFPHSLPPLGACSFHLCPVAFLQMCHLFFYSRCLYKPKF